MGSVVEHRQTLNIEEKKTVWHWAVLTEMISVLVMAAGYYLLFVGHYFSFLHNKSVDWFLCLFGGDAGSVGAYVFSSFANSCILVLPIAAGFVTMEIFASVYNITLYRQRRQL